MPIEEEIAQWLADRMDDELRRAVSGPVQQQRLTALRVSGMSFETVELDDNGVVIEPVRCTCGRYAVFHRSNCPLHCVTP